MNHRYTFGIFLGAILVLALVVGCNKSSGGNRGGGPLPLMFTSGPGLPAGEVGTAYSTAITVSGGLLSYTWNLNTPGTFPPGLTLNPSTGSVTGDPTLDGNYSFGVTVSDSSNPVQMITDTFTIVVTVSALTFTTGSSLPAGEVGTLYSTGITVSGGTLPYMWNLDTPTTFPPGLTLIGSTGIVTGNPTLDGNYSFDVTVSDSSNPVQMITDTFIIDVNPLPAPQVVINEVWGDHCHTGGEFVELLNIGTGAADLSNWTLEVYNNSMGGLNGAYTIPIGTMLPAGGLLVLWENTGTPTPTSLYVGFEMDSDWLPGAPGCAGVDLSEVVLLDDTGTGVDYIAINDTNMANLPVNLTFTSTFNCSNHDAYRRTQTDTDQPSDFSCGGLGSDTPGMLNPGQ
ncbi:MAG: lamin tail domain-containing protein [Planctomycetota bacterium]|nr:lamin tail domain-containing protein [Planctomycetota bacterium]